MEGFLHGRSVLDSGQSVFFQRSLKGVILSGARQRDMPVFVQVYPAIVILNAVKNPCILPEVP